MIMFTYLIPQTFIYRAYSIAATAKYLSKMFYKAIDCLHN